MQVHKKNLLTTVAAVVLAFAVGACSSNGDNEETAAAPPPATTDPAPEPSDPTNDQVAASQTALDAYARASLAHTMAQTAYDADMSVANATALQTAATALQAAATAAHTAIEAGASEAQKEAFGDTAVADATTAVTSAGDAVTLANAIVTSQGTLEAYALALSAHTAARDAYVADASVANATALQTEATALQTAAMAAHAAIAAGSTDAQKAEFGDTAVADASAAVAEAAAFVIAARLAAGEAADELERVQTAVTTAMTAAGVASTEAQTAATAAKDAQVNRATRQTGDLHPGNSDEHAGKAQEHADLAAAAAKNAGDANVAAMAATDVEAATRALAMAETAEKTAVKQQGYAETERDNAVTATMGELYIVDTVKTVGDTDLDAAALNKKVTTIVDGKIQVVDTGLQADLNPKAVDVGEVEGRAFEAAVQDGAAEITYRQDVAFRTFDIGKVVDSEYDTARLMIVTKYAGSETVKVFAYAEDAPAVTLTAEDGDGRTGTVLGKVTLDDDDASTTDTNNTSLRSEGVYYQAGLLGDTDGLAATDEVASDAESTTVFSYVDDQGTADTEDDVKVYLVYDRERKEQGDSGTTTYIYRMVDITAPSLPDSTGADGDADTLPDEGQVTANIPEATEYNHIHFGVWASLKENGRDVGDLGIGFVQNYSFGGLTSIGGGPDDMPNGGEATYNGNWVAAVQARDEDGNGDISLQSGVASLMADFGEAEITATLAGLATLEGKIDTNTFKGTEATVMGDNPHGLNSDGEFTGLFRGGFYGTRAVEAAGIFDFTSDRQEDGAFSGAFGGKN